MRNPLTHRALKLRTLQVRLTVTAECRVVMSNSGRKLYLFKVSAESILNAF